MLKKLFCLAVLCFGVNAKATVINIELDKSSYETSDVISARFIVDDYKDGLAGFMLNLSFLSNKLGFVDVTFGTQFTPFTDVNFTTVDHNNGALYIDEANLYDNYLDLAALQQGTITLATVRFTALVAGLYDLSIDNAQLWDAVSNSNIGGFSFNGAKIQVNGAPAPVSAPATALLLLPAVWLLRRRRA